MTLAPDNLFIDLDDIDVGELILLSEEGSRGIPEFAASCTNPGPGPFLNATCLCSCAIPDPSGDGDGGGGN